jgi:prophage DNA circulation protein
MTQTLADAVHDMDQHAHAVLSTLPDQIEQALAVMGYSMSLLLHGIEPQFRLEAARGWVIVLLNNVHRGVEDQLDATKH